MMEEYKIRNQDEEEIVEQSIYGESQFREMIRWLKDRQGFELSAQITGSWLQTGDFFKGRGKVLKKFDGTMFDSRFFLLLNEGNMGKDDILIGRRIVEISSRKPIKPFQTFTQSMDKELKDSIEESIRPNVFVFDNSFKKDTQNQVFFRNEDYDRAITWLESFTKKYEISCHIEGILVDQNRQIPCIITGTVKSVNEKEIFIQLWDAFNPLDPLDDEAKEWLSRDWTIQVAQIGVNKVHPKFMLFEIGEELALTKKVLNVEDVKVTLGGRVIIHDVNFSRPKRGNSWNHRRIWCR